jgi:hypothetical protein
MPRKACELNGSGGRQSVNDMYVAGGLPDSVRRLLYPILGGGDYPVRGLREKLIVFGLFCNMNEDDMDLMLGYAKLRAFSPQPGSNSRHEAVETSGRRERVDAVLAALVNEAHALHAYYEYDCVDRIYNNIVDVISGKAGTEQEIQPVYQELKGIYAPRLSIAEQLCLNPPAEMDERDEIFEYWYGSHLLELCMDALRILVLEGLLEEKEIRPYIELVQHTGILSEQ